MFEFKINKEIVLNLENEQAEVFEELYVYASNSAFLSLDGKIRNLWVETKVEEDDGYDYYYGGYGYGFDKK